MPCYSNIQNVRQHVAFLSKKINLTQQKYSAYDSELLAIYEAVKHFRHMLEARYFIIFTDHKLITYLFQQKRDKCSSWQFSHLDFIDQITTDIEHIS
jgi:cleavage and polyadenylation specificity factor subunit 1